MSARLSGAWIGVLFCVPLCAGSLTVTVKDPGQGLVADAAVEVAAADNASHREVTDSSGRVTFQELAAGSYKVAVTKDGFANWEGSVKVGDRPVSLAVSLKLAAVSSSVRVSARRSPLANSDPNYQALRTGRLSKVYRVSNLVLTRDAGTFTFHSGSFSFLAPVMGHVTTGVFVGDGNFQIKPAGDLAAIRLKRMMGSDSVNEDFTAMVVFFSDATFDEIKGRSEIVDESPVRHEEEFKRVRSVIQGRREPMMSWPRSQLELLLNYDDIPNYDAEILAEIYNGAVGEHAGSFRAFLHGKKYADLRFLLNPHEALPVLHAPEEVAVINFNPNSYADGVWYLSHTVAELQAARANSKEEKRLIAADHYKMEVLIGDKNLLGVQPDLAVTCEMTFHPMEDGVRMVKLDLVPDLQVTRVNWNGSEIPFVQESRNHDGSFYLQAPEPLKKGNSYKVTFEYGGGEILQSKFDYVPPTRIWYPTPAGPVSRATYDLKFRIAHGTKIVAVGNPVGVTRDGDWDVSEWKADTPITQAVFRWLEDATLMTEVEETTKSQMSLYRALTAHGFQPPSGNYTLGDIGNALRVFNLWFGKSGYDNITFLEQTGGPIESLPGLIYARPVLMMGSAAVVSRIGGPLPAQISTRLDEAFPRLMAGQWWGNTVSAASFHDQWLTEGLTHFSASVYDLDDRARGNGVFQDRWVGAREAIVTRAYKGQISPNDAGPVWMGILNDTPAAPPAGEILNANKGAYMIQMLRAMMWDPQSLDRDFQAMMQDFVARFRNQAVSSEDFEAIVEKHMKPVMDLAGDHRMNWYFDEWLRGTDVPSYRFEYSLAPGENGGTTLQGALTQSGVSPSFRMLVPVFVEAGERNYRVCVVALQGNSTGECKAALSARPKQVLLNANHDVLADKESVNLIKAGGR